MTDEVVSEVGGVFDVELREPGSTGYRWSIAKLPSAISLINEGRKTSGIGHPGQALSHTFQLKASRPGQYEVTFQLKRPWEQRNAEVKTVKVKVRA